MDECEVVKCKGCGADMIFLTSIKSGKKIPVNPKLITIMTKDGYFHKGFETHFSTCPQADKFRQPNGQQQNGEPPK